MSLFIGRLPLYGFSSKDLEDIFSKYGMLTDCKVLRGRYYCYGFVDYEINKDMYDAIRNEHGRLIDGNRIVVEKAIQDKIPINCNHCGKNGHTSRNCWNNGRITDQDSYHHNNSSCRGLEDRKDCCDKNDIRNYYGNENDGEFNHCGRGYRSRERDDHRKSHRESSSSSQEAKRHCHLRSPQRRHFPNSNENKRNRSQSTGRCDEY